MGNSYISIDLDDPRAANIAEVISNKTCKKLLSMLAEKELSEGDLAKGLGIPINTAEYNLKKLIDAGLIEKSKGFFWSAKGKKIPTYRLVNKKILISPRSVIKGVLPAVIASLVFASIIKLYSWKQASLNYVGGAYDNVVNSLKSSETFSDVLVSNAPKMANDVQSIGMDAWVWFLFGALVSLLVLIIWNLRKNR